MFSLYLSIPVTNKKGLSTPFEYSTLSFWDSIQFNFNLGHSQYISRCSHCQYKVGYKAFGCIETSDSTYYKNIYNCIFVLSTIFIILVFTKLLILKFTCSHKVCYRLSTWCCFTRICIGTFYWVTSVIIKVWYTNVRMCQPSLNYLGAHCTK